MLSIIQNAQQYLNRTAICSNGEKYTYQTLLTAAHSFATTLLMGKNDLGEARVAFMVTPGFDYVKVQWAIWQAGGIAVPLCLSHPLPSLQYVIEDSEVSIIVVSPLYEELLSGLAKKRNIRLLVPGKESEKQNASLPEIDSSR